MTRILAFVISRDDDEQDVVFAGSAAIARAENANADEIHSLDVQREPAFDEHAPGPVPVRALLEHGWYSHCSASDCSRRICYADGEWAQDASEQDLADTARAIARMERRRTEWIRDNPKPGEPAADDRTAEGWRARQQVSDWQRRLEQEVPRPPMVALDRNALRFDGPRVWCSIRCQQDHLLTIARVDLLHEIAEEEARRRWPQGRDHRSSRWPNLEPRVRFRLPGFENDVEWHPDDDGTFVYPNDLERWNAMHPTRHREEMVERPS